MSCLRENGPVRFPSSAMYQTTPSSTGGAGGRAVARRSRGGAGGGVGSRGATIVARGAEPVGAAAPPTGITGDDGLRAPSSRTVMMFAQDLHRTLRIFPRTLSSAMEYLVWQRSQTNFMSLQRFAPPRPFRPKPVGKLSSKGQD